MKDRRPLSEKLFRVLLRLYPSALRESYGDPMTELFKERLGRKRHRVWGTLAKDLFKTWIHHLRTGRRPPGAPLKGRPAIYLRDLTSDLRLGVRLALRHWRHSLVAVLALGAGVGVATYAFGVYYGSFGRGLPVSEPQRAVHVSAALPSQGRPHMDLGLADFWEIRRAASTLEDLAAYCSDQVNLASPGRPPQQVEALYATASLFPLLEASPMLGRALLEHDHQASAPSVAVLGYGLWSSRFQSRRDIVGETVTVDGAPVEIVGVMPRHFSFPWIGMQLWLPLPLADHSSPSAGMGVDGLGRLSEGAGLSAVQAQLDALAESLRNARPESHQGYELRVRPFAHAYRSATMITQMRLTTWAGGLILLVALANVSNLLLLRGYSRLRELGLRRALGAGRGRILRQFLAESAVLAVLGGALGAVLAWWGLGWYQAQWPDGYIWWIFKMDRLAWVVVLASVLAACGLAGAFPVLQLRRMNLEKLLRQRSRGHTGGRFSRLGSGFLALQIGLGGALLFIAALMVQSALNLYTVDYGFAIDDVFTARVSLDRNSYPEREDRLRFWDALQRRARTLPGVREAALATQLPMIRRGGGTRFAIEGESYPSDRYPLGYRDIVTPEFFAAFEKSLLRGRGFSPADNADSEPVVIVNEDFVRRYFAEGPVLGRRIRLGGPDSEAPWMTVIGVAPHMWMDTDVNAFPQGMYIPLAQHDPSSMSVALRVSGRPDDYIEPLRDLLFDMDPNLALHETMSMQRLIYGRTTVYRRTAPQFVAFGLAALLVAVVGLYAVISYMTRTRTAEIGIRMALGAKRPDVLRLIVGQGIIPVVCGLLLGVATSLYLSQGISRFLFELDPWDWRVLAASFALLTLTALLAMTLPALRATRINPTQALRSE
ncbi:MAG TPA: ABC transporter permease [Acidobacteriota bacterium]|nr:ABC transporter permease [Acidobacteriota bacterium]